LPSLERRNRGDGAERQKDDWTLELPDQPYLVFSRISRTTWSNRLMACIALSP
jgi:hypothetical protein